MFNIKIEKIHKRKGDIGKLDWWWIDYYYNNNYRRDNLSIQKNTHDGGIEFGFRGIYGYCNRSSSNPELIKIEIQFISTHDIALCQLLNENCKNYEFELDKTDPDLVIYNFHFKDLTIFTKASKDLESNISGIIRNLPRAIPQLVLDYIMNMVDD